MTDQEQRLMKVGIEESEKIFAKLLKDYPELDNDDPRQLTVIATIFINCIKHLHREGADKEYLHSMIDNWIEE